MLQFFLGSSGSPSDPPTAPTLDDAIALGHNLVGLYWTNGANQTSHEIHRSETAEFTPSGATLIDTLEGGSDTAYADSSAEAETTYYYQVVAVNDIGSAASNELSVETPAAPSASGSAGMSLLVRRRRRR